MLRLRNGFTLRTTSTLSAGAFPQVGDFSVGIWFTMPATVSATQTLMEWTNGTDSSRMTVNLTTSKTVSLQGSTSAGTNGAGQTGTLSTGLHYIQIRKFSGAAYQIAADNGSPVNLSASFSFDTALTLLCIGSKQDSTRYVSDVNILRFWVSTTRHNLLSDYYSSGVASEEPEDHFSDITYSAPFLSDEEPTTGTSSWAMGCEPEYVDDEAYTGIAWEASDFAQIPAIRNGSVLLKSGNCDNLICSDSFGYIEPIGFVPWLINEWGRAAGARIKKIVADYSTETAANGIVVQATSPITGTGTAVNAINHSDEYVWSDSGRLAIPLGGPGVNIATGTSPTGDIINFKAANSTWFNEGAFESWIQSGDVLRFTPLVRVASANQLAAYQQLDNDTDATEVTVSGTTSQLNPQTAKDCSEDVSGARVLTIKPSGGTWDAADQSKYLDIMGVKVENLNVTNGLGLCSIADSSWSIAGHAVNTGSSAGTNTQIKRYSDAQVDYLVDAFCDSSRRLYIWLWIATEQNIATALGDFVTRWDARMAAAGITNYRYVVVSTFFHQIDGDIDAEYCRPIMRAAVSDMDALAAADSRICHISLYKLTNGNYWHSSSSVLAPNGANDAQQAWLTAYDAEHSTDYSTTPGRANILDNGELHLKNESGAQMMAEIVARAIVENGSNPSGGRTGVQRLVQQRIHQGVQQYITN